MATSISASTNVHTWWQIRWLGNMFLLIIFAIYMQGALLQIIENTEIIHHSIFLSRLVGNVQLWFCHLPVCFPLYVHQQLRSHNVQNLYMTIILSSLPFSVGHMIKGFVCDTILAKVLSKVHKRSSAPGYPSCGSISLSIRSFPSGLYLPMRVPSCLTPTLSTGVGAWPVTSLVISTS